MHQQGILKTDDLITRFFRLCTEMCVEISYRAQAEQQHNPAASAAIIRAKCYHNLDAFVRLIALLVKHSGEATNTVTKINLLNKVQQRRGAEGEPHVSLGAAARLRGGLVSRLLTLLAPLGAGYRGRSADPGPRCAADRVPAAALPPHLHHAAAGAECT